MLDNILKDQTNYYLKEKVKKSVKRTQQIKRKPLISFQRVNQNKKDKQKGYS